MWYSQKMDIPKKTSVPVILWILIISVIIVLGQSIYKNYILRDYTFYVEAQCDTSANECYVRSCEVEGDCPPNNLETYRAFELPASEFQYCSDNSCLNICPSEEHLCEELLCSDQEDVDCEGPTLTLENNGTDSIDQREE